MEIDFKKEPEIIIKYHLRTGKYYYRGYKNWNIDYNFGWTLDVKEAKEFDNEEEIFDTIKEVCKEEYQQTFGSQEYKIKKIIKVKLEE